MGSVIQWIIVGILVGGAIIYFATRKKIVVAADVRLMKHVKNAEDEYCYR